MKKAGIIAVLIVSGLIFSVSAYSEERLKEGAYVFYSPGDVMPCGTP